MGLFGSLTVAVSGLNAQSASIGNISDNLANTQTTGYKRVDTRFETLVTSSSARAHSPGGVIASPRFQHELQGSLSSTTSATDLAITGNGFFVVTEGATNPEITYTRRGDFQLDNQGFLVNGSGQFLRGYNVDPATGVVDTSAAVPIQIDLQPGAPEATENVTVDANIPAGGTGPFTTGLDIVDSLGRLQRLTLSFAPDGTNPNEWDLTISSPNATAGLPGAPQVVTFDGLGALTSAGTITLTGLQFDTPATGVNTDPVDVAIDISQLTQFGNARNELTVTELSQDGVPLGNFDSLVVNDEGFITVNFTNGTQRTEAQIPLATFPVPNLLQRLDGGGFAQTLESGQPLLNAPGVGGAGGITPSALEGSNVDIADEFSKLIVSQRVFSANARVITTSDRLLEEVTNLVR